MTHLLTRAPESPKVLLWSQRIGRLRPSPLQFGVSLSEPIELTALIELIRLDSVNSVDSNSPLSEAFAQLRLHAGRISLYRLNLHKG